MSDAWDFVAGKDEKTVVKPAAVDGSAYQYGGWAGGAQMDVDRARKMGADAQAREGVAMDGTAYNADRALEYGARGQQGQGLGMQGEGVNAYRDAMNGVGTSVAQQQLQMGTNAAVANSASLAAGARGGGANLASAQRAAMNAGSQAIGQGSQQAAMLRAQEIAQARQGFQSAAQGYTAGAGQMRAGDQGRTGQSAQWAQGQAQLQDAQRGRNDQMQMQNEANAYGVASQQLGAQQARAGQETGAANEANKAAAAMNKDSAEKDAGLIGKVIQTGGSTASSVVQNSDENNKIGIQPLTGPGMARGSEGFDGRKNAEGYQGTPGAMSGHAPSQASTDAEIMAHPGEGGPWAMTPTHGDEANAKLHAVKMAYGSGNQRAMDVGFGDMPVYAKNAGGVSSVEGGDVGSDASSRTPIQFGQARNSMALTSDAHSKDAIASLSAENSALKAAAGHAADYVKGGGVVGEGVRAGARVAENAGVQPGFLRGSEGQPSAPEQFMDTLKPYAFNYKAGTPGEDPKQRYAGVMAQDVEKSPMGATFVKDTPQGKKLDIQHGFGTALAALGDLNQRLKQVEGSKAPEFHYGPKRGK